MNLSEMCQPGSKRHPWCQDEECECLCHGPWEGEPVAVVELRRAA